MWVKICANTNLKDAELAADLGADAIGFVFAPSKRQVTEAQVAAIVPHLPVSLEKIGVFVTRNAEEIVGIIRATGLTGVQLHSGFELELARRLRAQLQDVAIIQALHWVVGPETGNAAEIATQLRAIAREPAIDRVLIDSKTAGTTGGSGVSFDWTAARETLANSETKLIVAGGLVPENVAEAIAVIAPWGVDVASGVEGEPGRKSLDKLQRFLENAH